MGRDLQSRDAHAIASTHPYFGGASWYRTNTYRLMRSVGTPVLAPMMERMRGIEPLSSAWKAVIIPLYYIRNMLRCYGTPETLQPVFNVVFCFRPLPSVLYPSSLDARYLSSDGPTFRSMVLPPGIEPGSQDYKSRASPFML